MKALSKNMIMSVLASVVSLVAGLVTQRYILMTFGSSLNGLTSSISQVMSYLVLLEAGLGTASIQALYRPLASNDWDKISGIFTATGHAYKKISLLFGSLLIGAALLLPLIVKDEVEYFTAGLLTLLTGGSYIISYIMGGKYSSLINADRKVYILYAFDILSVILSAVLRIMAINAGYSIVTVQLVNLIITLLKNILYVVYVKLHYSHLNWEAPCDYQAIHKRWNVLVHSLAGMVVSHTDITILTLFSTLKTVSVYSVYNMIFSRITMLLQSAFSSATQASFGRLYNQDSTVFIKYFRIFEFLFTVILLGISSIALVMTLPFVRVYTRGVSDINYLDSILPILFSVIMIMNLVRVPASVLLNISGAFKDTQFGAIMEAAINIVVSLFLFFFTDLGMRGLLLGTVCSYIYRTCDIIIYIYRHVLKISLLPFLRMLTANIACMILNFWIFYIIHPIMVNTFLEWILAACIVSICNIVLFLIVNIIVNYSLIRSTISVVTSFSISHKSE